MSQLEVIKYQPNFPNEDLDPANKPFIEYYLQEHTEADSHARGLEENLRALHLTAHHALQLSGIEVDYTPKEYKAFCEGFASLEYMSMMVNPRYIREQLVVKNVHLLLTANGIMPEFDLSDRRQAWVDVFPNITDVLSEESSRKDESLPELYSRVTGAQLAAELQMTA